VFGAGPLDSASAAALEDEAVDSSHWGELESESESEEEDEGSDDEKDQSAMESGLITPGDP
jgi:hypothetical protein